MKGRRESRASWQEGLLREKAMPDGGQRIPSKGYSQNKGSQHRVLWNLFFKHSQDTSISLVLLNVYFGPN